MENNNQLQLQQNRELKELQGLIDAIVLREPTIKDRLTVAAVWSFMQLPDDSFGWIEKSGAPMPKAAKFLSIATALRLDLMPGLGHIYFLGNKLYISVEGMRHLANKSHEFKFVGKRKIRPLTNDECLMLDIQPGDRAIALEQPVHVRGQTVETTSYGILEKNELEARGHNNRAMPGRGSKKDIYQTLVTRAERDLFKHFLPLADVCADEAPEVEYVESKVLPAPKEPSMDEILAARKAEKEITLKRSLLLQKLSKLRADLVPQTESMSIEEIEDLIHGIETQQTLVEKPVEKSKKTSKPKLVDNPGSDAATQSSAVDNIPVSNAIPIPRRDPVKKALVAIAKLLTSNNLVAEVKDILVRLQKATIFIEADDIKLARLVRESCEGSLNAFTDLVEFADKRIAGNAN